MTHARVLADRILPGEGVAWDALRVVAGSLLVALCAQISLPLPWSPVPFTGQTFGVLFVAVLLGPRRALLAMMLYLLEGAAGLPVFQKFGLPGALRLLGPTAGYLWMYPLAAFVTGWFAEKISAESMKTKLQLGGAVLLGHALILLGGWAWLAAMPHLQTDFSLGTLGWSRAFAVGVAPFLADAVLKTVLVLGAARGAERVRAQAG
ncbi:MAG TPA: biotin transporter BioY [Candidatus Nitrosotenuis sp.]|nr:biotin transporter BioY [Candidatus Nitrosotenuis sp.]